MARGASTLVSNQVFRMDVWTIECDAPEYVRAMKQVASLRHPHAAAILEFGVHGDNQGWALSQFPKSESLSDTLTRSGQPDQKQALETAFAVSRALEMAHDRGFAHGRISSDHIFEFEGKTVLAGWGHIITHDRRELEQKKDLEAFAEVIRCITPAPPAPLRALLDSPPKTAGAFDEPYPHLLALFHR